MNLYCILKVLFSSSKPITMEDNEYKQALASGGRMICWMWCSSSSGTTTTLYNSSSLSFVFLNPSPPFFLFLITLSFFFFSFRFKNLEDNLSLYSAPNLLLLFPGTYFGSSLIFQYPFRFNLVSLLGFVDYSFAYWF